MTLVVILAVSCWSHDNFVKTEALAAVLQRVTADSGLLQHGSSSKIIFFLANKESGLIANFIIWEYIIIEAIVVIKSNLNDTSLRNWTFLQVSPRSGPSQSSVVCSALQHTQIALQDTDTQTAASVQLCVLASSLAGALHPLHHHQPGPYKMPSGARLCCAACLYTCSLSPLHAVNALHLSSSPADTQLTILQIYFSLLEEGFKKFKWCRFLRLVSSFTLWCEAIVI